MEREVHNTLVDQGFPVPYVHYACIDHKFLGYEFLIMDHVPGEILPFVFAQDTNAVLGKTHAAIHNADPSKLNQVLIL